MLRSRGADPPKTVGAGRGERRSDGPQQGQRDRMVRQPQGDRIPASRHDVRNSFTLRQYQRQGPGPKLRHQAIGQTWFLPHQRIHLPPFMDVNDQRIVQRAFLCHKNPGGRAFIQRQGRQSIDRFRRKCDQRTGAQRGRGFLNHRRIAWKI